MEFTCRIFVHRWCHAKTQNFREPKLLWLTQKSWLSFYMLIFFINYLIPDLYQLAQIAHATFFGLFPPYDPHISSSNLSYDFLNHEHILSAHYILRES